MNTLTRLLFVAYLSSAGTVAADTVWSASVDNGCKPGIGFRLIQSSRGIGGTAYLLDPDHERDFSHGVKRKMTITKSKPTELRFKLDWGDGKQRFYVLQFDGPLASKPVKGTVREEPANGEPIEFTFHPTRPKMNKAP